MTQEIERKFLVKDGSWKEQLSEKHPEMLISHAYLINKPAVTIRLQYRFRPAMNERKAAINIKSPREGLSRNEIELPFDPYEAIWILEELRKTHPVIDKVRSFVDIDDKLYWEIDEFITAPLKGLVLAEVEIPDTEHHLDLPDWISEEVTHKVEYYNAFLAGKMEVPEPDWIDEDVERNFIRNWSFLLNSDGTVDLNKLKLELDDFSFLIREVPKVYDHVAGLSKHKYPADVINREADERYWKFHREMILDDTEGMTVEEIRKYLGEPANSVENPPTG